MTAAIHLKLVGLSLLALSAINVYSVKRFNWRQELAQVSLLTRQVFFVHLFFIVLLLVGMALLTLCFTSALLAPSPLASLLLAGLTLFWAVRLVFQWFVYDRELWHGQRFNTIVHYAFSGLWAYYTAVFAWAWCNLQN